MNATTSTKEIGMRNAKRKCSEILNKYGLEVSKGKNVTERSMFEIAYEVRTKLENDKEFMELLPTALGCSQEEASTKLGSRVFIEKLVKIINKKVHMIVLSNMFM